MTVFEEVAYKDALRKVTESRRNQFGNRFTFERVANACGVQKTYLSRVLNGPGHLNADQLFAACEFLKLTATETDYVLLLRERELASHPKRIRKIDDELKRIQAKQLKIEDVIEDLGRPQQQHQSWEYYSDTDLLLVHIFLTSPRFANSPKEIATALSIPEPRLQQILMTLQSWKLIRFEKGRYVLDQPMQHLPKDSPIFRSHASSLRLRTLERIRQSRHEDDYIFSTVFSAEASYQNQLKKMLIDLLKKAQADVVKAEAEDVYQLNIDLFRWS